MHYLLNGGGREFQSLASPEVSDWLHAVGVKNILIVAFALKEDYWQKIWATPPAQISLSDMNLSSLSMVSYTKLLAKSCLAQADAVWFPGGSPEVLLSRVRSTGFLELLLAAQANSSLKVIGGASAGEMALGQRTVVGKQTVSDVVGAMGVIPGHLFDSHFSDRGRLSRLKAVIDNEPQLTGVGIDENTSLILDAAYQPQAIFGPGTVTYYNAHKEPVTYHAKTQFRT